VVSVFAIASKVRGSNRDRGRCIYKDDKNKQHVFGGEVKPSVPCRKFLPHAKESVV
jgi:hypothetical protein